MAPELRTATVATGVGLAAVLAAALAGWPGQAIDCTASLCFCEAARPGLVRQVANTWSNLAAVVAGFAVGALAAAGRTRRQAAGRVDAGADVLGLAFPPVLVFQGVGSMFFHGGLVTWGHALDAMSMFASVGLLVATNFHRLGWLAAGAIVPTFSALMVLGLAVGLVSGDAVTALVFLQFLTVLATEVLLTARGRAPSAGLFRLGLAIHLTGVGVWFASAHEGLPLCSPDSLWQGHALWHATAAAGVALFALHALRNLELVSPGPGVDAQGQLPV